MKPPEKVLRTLRDNEVFLLAIHINPDGDALGSALALEAALKVMGKSSYLFCRDEIPDFYRFLPGSRRFSQGIRKNVATRAVLLLLDCNSLVRASLEGMSFKESVVIDHHETESDFGNVRWIDHTAAATGMMVFALIKSLGVELTGDMATNLYTAIAVDTGTFRYSNTSAEVLKVAARLVEAGADPHMIATSLYERWERKRFDLLVHSLNTLEVRDGIATTFVTKKMFQLTGTAHEDTENFANFPRMIEGVNIAAVFRQMEGGRWKVSIRSKGEKNVARVAEFFGGGGHKNAAGFRITGDLETVKGRVFAACRKKA